MTTDILSVPPWKPRNPPESCTCSPSPPPPPGRWKMSGFSNRRNWRNNCSENLIMTGKQKTKKQKKNVEMSLPQTVSYCVSVFVAGNFEWWHKLTDTEKGAVIGGPLFVILFIISISCCCCCKRSNCCSCRCLCRWGYSCDISSWCLSGERTIECSLLKAWKLTINKSYSLGPLLKLFLQRLLLISFLWLTQAV